ncbi:Hypothetical predicted protein, partial [Pelobates cultripes]
HSPYRSAGGSWWLLHISEGSEIAVTACHCDLTQCRSRSLTPGGLPGGPGMSPDRDLHR